MIYQSISGRVVAAYQLVMFQFRKNVVGKLLAQLHTPLIKAEDVPDDPLYKYLMLVKSDKLAQHERGDFFHQKGISGTVTRKNLKWN